MEIVDLVRSLYLSHPVFWSLAVVVSGIVLGGVRVIPNNRVGIIERLWSPKGSVRSGVLALGGEAGFVPELLRGGLHYYLPFQYRIHILPLVTIPQGKIGYLFARDGRSLLPAQALASNDVVCNFEDARGFLEARGQKGPQRQILREGTYAIHLGQFVVITEGRIFYLPMHDDEAATFERMAKVIEERDGFQPLVITKDLVGIVTVHDGPSLLGGEIVAPVVGDDPSQPELCHNNFQDADRFLQAGGRRGRQQQVLVEGTFYINRLFATVETIPKTEVEVGSVGVVVSFTGDTGADLSGDGYRHGELVAVGNRGVWDQPLMPGKYAFNTYAGRITMVPTTNFMLKWNRRQSGVHRFDENLSEVALITRDAFEPLLPLSVVVHIDYRKAPLVIQRFGDIKRLVEQTLDPMVSAYLKNIAQTRTLIQLIHDRSSIQHLACEEMREKFQHYNLELEEVLIGTPSSPDGDHHIEDILGQLRSRQVAEEQVETYARQEKAAVKERELREAEARAHQQREITESELGIQIASNQGKADLQRALQQADQIRATADAEADRVRSMGQAEADRVERVGMAQAAVITQQVQAYGGSRFQLTQAVMSRFCEAIERSGVDVVPRVMVGSPPEGGASGSHGSVVEALVAMLLGERMGSLPLEDAASTRPGAEAVARPLPAPVARVSDNGRHTQD